MTLCQQSENTHNNIMCIFYAIKIKVNNYNGIMFQAKLNF
ncbi:hypothetical protein HMPREF0216_00471 [Clostridium celatum DSM 1785]|uniref:Uncharacterized protein n=1 Tax=Clostridium celatum DSM 1785 TaxID=545697 RepID=L1QNG7_9CLOT|nr:hypothetical protein HMPREF0216_00471 [Clostridium celatum DSM 1785]